MKNYQKDAQYQIFIDRRENVVIRDKNLDKKRRYLL